MTVSKNIRLYGTEQEPLSSRLLKAGKLTAEFEDGNLRYIRYKGIEVIRAISFITRDKDWGTFAPQLHNIHIEEDGNNFSLSYGAKIADENQSLHYHANISGDHRGKLVFSAKVTVESDFLTNRTGFVILHPINHVADKAARIQHVDGTIEETVFPSIIDPVQPMKDMRCLTHWACDNSLQIDCLMEGDSFEMEDQRNWTDASYKTYVRPLALPWPYTLEKDSIFEQKITLTINGDIPTITPTDHIEVSIGELIGKVPHLGIACDGETIEKALSVSSQLEQLKAHHLICHFDKRKGHNSETLAKQFSLAKTIGAEPWLEAVVTSVDDFKQEIEDLGQMVDNLPYKLPFVMLSPANDMKCTLPGSIWPKTPPANEMYLEGQKAFPHSKIVGGMFSYFTELNRKRPPLDHLALVTFTTSALVHAGDDRSVMETLEALPAIGKSVKNIAQNVPFSVGPSAIGMRDNPYGDAAKENPLNIRQAMNLNDPRQRGLLGAAWALGYFSRFSYSGAQYVAIGNVVGSTGVVNVANDFPQPYFDKNGLVYPMYHVLRGLAQLQGGDLYKLDNSDEASLLGIAADHNSGHEIWLANLKNHNITVKMKIAGKKIAVLNLENFVEATNQLDFMDKTNVYQEDILSLSPYSIVRITDI